MAVFRFQRFSSEKGKCAQIGSLCRRKEIAALFLVV